MEITLSEDEEEKITFEVREDGISRYGLIRMYYKFDGEWEDASAFGLSIPNITLMYQHIMNR